MAFSHRPTWHAARARGSTFDLRNYSTGGVASKQIQELDLANHMKMKYREIGQGRSDEVAQRDLVKELEDKEKKHYEEAGKFPKNYGRIKDADEGESQQAEEKPADQKAEEEEFDDSDDAVSSSGESSSEDDEAEQEELMRELEKIKKEREEAKKREEEEAVEIEAKIMQQEQQQKKAELNPGSFSGTKVKRRWDEDVVFR